jgi:hypothetical protein
MGLGSTDTNDNNFNAIAMTFYHKTDANIIDSFLKNNLPKMTLMLNVFMIYQGTVKTLKQIKYGTTQVTVSNPVNCVGFEVLTVVVMKSTILWDVTSCSPLRVNQHFGGTYCHQLQGRKIRWFLAQLIFSTLKMEAKCSSETSVDTQRTTRRYIPEDGTL